MTLTQRVILSVSVRSVVVMLALGGAEVWAADCYFDCDCDGQLSTDVLMEDSDCVDFGDDATITSTCSLTYGYYRACDTDAGEVRAETSSIAGDDCNDSNNEFALAATYYLDCDGDGYGQSGETRSDCGSTPSQLDAQSECWPFVVSNTNWVVEVEADCNDQESTYFPGSTVAECDADKDSNCDGLNDGTTYYLDCDGDGFGGTAEIDACFSALPIPVYCDDTEMDGQWVVDFGDCNDANIAIYPISTNSDGSESSAPEDALSEFDNNCDSKCIGKKDGDDDGYPLSSASDCTVEITVPGESCGSAFPSEDGNKCARLGEKFDCVDDNAKINPGITEEIFSSTDFDCSGTCTYYVDGDGDGIGTNDPCTRVTKDGTQGTECYGVGDDDGDTSGACSTTSGTVFAGTYYSDSTTGSQLFDCDDNTSARYPGNTEVCEDYWVTQVDNDCDEQINDAATVETIFYRDVDGDGYGVEGEFKQLCGPGLLGGDESDDYYTVIARDYQLFDCNDDEAAVNPSAAEVCGSIGRDVIGDEDCDGLVDELVETSRNVWDGPAGCTPWNLDYDEDGQGDPNKSLCLCESALTPICGENYSEENEHCSSLRFCATTGAGEDCVEEEFTELWRTFYVIDGGGVPFVKNPSDCLDTDHQIYFDSARPDRLDGYITNCDDTLSLFELDCDGDRAITGEFNQSLEESDCNPENDDQLTLTCAGGVEVIARCGSRNVDLGDSSLTRISTWYVDVALPKPDDATSGFGSGYELINRDEQRRLSNPSDGADCDDIEFGRSPGEPEKCDGVDNNCSGSGDCDPLNAATGTCSGLICDVEADPDCDGFITCALNDLVDEEVGCRLVLDPAGTCDQVFESLGTGDTFGYCARSWPFTEPNESDRCDGIFPPNSAYMLTGEVDSDQDGHYACGPEEGDPVEESVFLLVYFSPDDPSTTVGDSFEIPLLLPRAVEVQEDSGGAPSRAVVASDRFLQWRQWEALVALETANTYVDSSAMLAPVLNGHTYAEQIDGYSKVDPLFDLCVRAELCDVGRDEEFPWCSAIGNRRCAVVELTIGAEGFIRSLEDLGDTADWLEPYDSALTVDAVPGARVAGETGVRSVWSRERIVESRRRVIEWDCFITFGDYGCGHLREVPPDEDESIAVVDPALRDALARFMPASKGGGRMRDWMKDDMLVELERRDDWWKEVGRFRGSESKTTPDVLAFYSDSLLSCWGDPTVDPNLAQSVHDRVGGDCADGEGGAHRDGMEGPADLRGEFTGEIASCETCVDGLDNNCDGLVDCDDPACAPCFVGQGTGCAGAAEDSPCASSGGCSAGRGARSPFSGLLELGALLLAALVLPLWRRESR